MTSYLLAVNSTNGNEPLQSVQTPEKHKKDMIV